VNSVEIIAIGNEILLGMIDDTNSGYLARIVRGLGARLRHICVVPDDLETIAAEIRSTLARSTRLVLTCGGLGPTEDDLTLAAIAKATNRRLDLNASAREFVARRYREFADAGLVSSGELTEARLKMARLPEGARMIINPEGAAPACALEIGSTFLVSLPGVPRELKSIVEGPLQTLLVEALGAGGFAEQELTVECGDESVLAPVLSATTRNHPVVYIKSRAREFGRDIKFKVTLSAIGSSAEQANDLVRAARDEIARALAEVGIGVEP
jgi:molybdenum cofactor synthesis domain-containing protein